MIQRISPGWPVFYHAMASPVGPLNLFDQNEKLVGLSFVKDLSSEKLMERFKNRIHFTHRKTDLLSEAETQLTEYFNGRRHEFNLPLNPSGTEFQEKAWRALMEIPYGSTVSYGFQAEKIGGKKYARAVGQANHHNPIAIIIPCHRVIGHNGNPTGYAGGLTLKKWLIRHEAQNG